MKNAGEVQVVATPNELFPEVAEHVTQRQINKNFMRYLKETPKNLYNNLEYLKKSLDHNKAALFRILDENDTVCGIVQTNAFDENTHELEIGFRVDPNNQLRGMCSYAVAQVVNKLFQDKEVKHII